MCSYVFSSYITCLKKDPNTWSVLSFHHRPPLKKEIPIRNLHFSWSVLVFWGVYKSFSSFPPARGAPRSSSLLSATKVPSAAKRKRCAKVSREAFRENGGLEGGRKAGLFLKKTYRKIREDIRYYYKLMLNIASVQFCRHECLYLYINIYYYIFKNTLYIY